MNETEKTPQTGSRPAPRGNTPRGAEGWITRQLRLPEVILDAFRADSPEAFWMALDMTGEKPSFGLLLKAGLWAAESGCSVRSLFGFGVPRILDTLLWGRETLEKENAENLQ